MSRLIFFFLLFFTPLVAETAPIPEPTLPQELADELRKTEGKEPTAFAEQFSKMLFYLGLLLGLLFVVLWFLKKFQMQQGLKLNETNLIRVLETRALSHKSILYLVDVEENTYLIAESHSGLTLLGKIDENPNKTPRSPS